MLQMKTSAQIDWLKTVIALVKKYKSISIYLSINHLSSQLYPIQSCNFEIQYEIAGIIGVILCDTSVIWKSL